MMEEYRHFTEGVCRKSLWLIFMLSSIFNIQTSIAQENISHRLILIGDAGEINSAQTKVMSEAARFVIKGKTTTLFLGDNIYPSGLGLPKSSNEESTKKILQSQYVPMRQAGSAVYFLTGNHDWDKFGRNGLEKIKYFSAYLNEQKDTLLKVVPQNGCPDPTVIKLTNNLVVIAFDSEWWVYSYAKENPDSICNCHTTKEIIDQLSDLQYANRDKMIILADHHPFASYGPHGGYFPLKEHIFPLTAIRPNLYIPLPIIGSLYPFIRSNSYHPEDIQHPLYQDMIEQISSVFGDFPNFVNVSGHEHSLQMIQQDSLLQIVSGSGAKKTAVRKNRNLLYGKEAHGFVIADELPNKSVRFVFYELQGDRVKPAFTYIKPLVDYKKIERKELKLAQIKEDSIEVEANSKFGDVGKFHRTLFGENYRKEWSTKTKLPVIKISSIHGGLTPMQRGGGQQSRSLRLVDKTGKEWGLRSVNKYPETILPTSLRRTFAKDIVSDAMSAQHPYSALIVPVLSDAVGVPHANPIIGFVSPDSALGAFQKDFENTVCLLEEREPLGKSENTSKLYRELYKDNDYTIDSTLFLKAKLLDLLIGDWDRHQDQWRWLEKKTGNRKRYTPIPRDRDQVLHVAQGLFPKIATLPWIQPKLHNFDGDIKKISAFFLNGSKLDSRFLNQFSYEQWMKITNDFVAAITDDVLEKSLQRLPKESYSIRHHELLNKLKVRRSNLPKAMSRYYYFLNKIVDIQTSNKNELVELSDGLDKSLTVKIFKISKERKVEQQLYNKTFLPNVTKEVRIFTEGGGDSVIVNNKSNVSVRLIGGSGANRYVFLNSNKVINVYEQQQNAKLIAPNNKMNMHISKEPTFVAYTATNLYGKKIPKIIVGYNIDDGLLLGGGIKIINQGFLKTPYSNSQQISLTKALSTEAYNFKYIGEWLKVYSIYDFILQAKVLAPSNTQNYFGLGNNTELNEVENFKRFYRTRFNIFRLDPAFRWHTGQATTLAFGPAIEYYHFNNKDSIGRITAQPSLIGTYDSTTITQNKVFAGLAFDLDFDNRNNTTLTTLGTRFNIKAQAFKGLNNLSRSYLQITSELAIYQKIDRNGFFTIANRVGGGFTVGKTTFYQSLFLGGQRNLLGYRQYRFAGSHMAYNNLELRVKLAEIGSFILPGELGMTGFYDVGKVWAKGYDSNTWHQATGGGLYFVPAQLAVFQLVYGHSKEGWYPYFTMGLRF